MATDRYGVETKDQGFMESQPSYKDYTNMRRTVADQKGQSTTNNDGESKGYEGSSSYSGKDLSNAVSIGAKAAKFGGMDFGFGMSSAIGATKAGLKGDMEDAAKAGAIGLGKEAMGVLGGVAGQIGKAAIGIGTAASPAHAAASVATGTVGSVLGGMLGMAVAGPMGAYAGSKLGSMAMGTITDTVAAGIGDATDSREHEATKDALEDAGYSYSESESATSGKHNAPGTGGTKTEGAATEMGRASGDSGTGDTGGGDHGDHDSSGGMGGSGDHDSEAGGRGGV